MYDHEFGNKQMEIKKTGPYWTETQWTGKECWKRKQRTEIHVGQSQRSLRKSEIY